MPSDPGQTLTRELIAADPDGALEQIQQLIQESQRSASMITDLQDHLAKTQAGDPAARNHPERMAQAQADAERRAAELADENERLRGQLVDGNAQQTSLITGQAEALQAYREMVLKAEPQLPPALISGGTLDELNASVQSAREVVAHIQGSIAHSNQHSRVPAGAPMRTINADPAGMTRTEKLLYGVREARGEQMTG